MYNVTLGCVRATIVAVGKHLVLRIHTYPACNAHTPLSSVLFSIFSTLSHKRHDFRKKKEVI
jgi:hypothetical protein